LRRVARERLTVAALYVEALNFQDEAYRRLKVNHNDETAWER
jgi:hypothetical protein